MDDVADDKNIPLVAPPEVESKETLFVNPVVETVIPGREKDIVPVVAYPKEYDPQAGVGVCEF